MPAANKSLSSSSVRIASDRIRRRRVTTACVTCRDRRVKCDRSKPVCTHCRNGGRECKYMDTGAPKIEFVTEHRSQNKSELEANGNGSDTWRSVIQAQADLVKNSGDKRGGMPTWAVAEAQEPSHARAAQIPCTSRPYLIPIGVLGENFVAALTNEFPSKELCQLYFESFLLGVHPIVPLCHIPTLRQEFSECWTNISSNTSVEVLALILAVLHTGATNTIPPRVDESSIFLRLYEEIFWTIDISLYHIRDVGASIQLLQGYLIMNTYKASQLPPFYAFGFMPQTVRFAQSLRLHVDPTTGTPIEQEVRKRLWWHLVFLDMESIIASGLPPIIRPNGYTTSLPSLLHDNAITEQQGGDAIPRRGDFSPMMVAMQGHYQWAHHMQLWFEQLPTQKEVGNFKTIIDNLLLLLPYNESTESIWARTYLKMQVDRAYCMLGLRFWQLDKYERTSCQSEVVKTARSFLVHYLHLSKLPTPALNFEWYISGMLQPLQAVIILLMHLSACPSLTLPVSASNDCLSSRSLLDSVCSQRIKNVIAGNILPMRDLLNAGECPQRTNPRYFILKELLKKVWRKIGMDMNSKDTDPLGGRLEIDEGSEWKITKRGEGDWKRMEVIPMQLALQAEEQMVEHRSRELGQVDGDWGIMDPQPGELDSVLEEDPLDLLQWDEWESLTQGLFAS